MSRQATKDAVFIRMAILMSSLATCARRRVGCIMTDNRGRIIASGYNGVAAGMEHCSTHPCPGAKLPSGEGLDKCEAIHAEANALIQCKNPDDIHTVYCTASPCIHCVKMLMNTGAQRIVFDEEYPHSEAADLWREHGGDWIKF